ncbi:MAG: PLP-dependent aminotransferase family protein [Rubellimicrobium sp.]|nr:PLP-dependent aminotransferase family protein [Rubellimicrobium sp.]
MWEPRLREGARAKYLGLVEALEADIRAGVVAAGDRLPAQRAVARALGVDLTTVTRAFAEARRRGLIEASAGRGTFVAPARGTAGQAPARVDLGMNVPPDPPGFALRRRIAQGVAALLAGPAGGDLLHYQASTGTGADRRAAADWLGLRIPGTDAGRIVVASGGQSALHAVCATLLAPGEAVATGAMTYPGLKAVATGQGLRLVPLAMDAQGILPDAFEALCRRQPPRALYVIPDIHNPTTATLPEDRRRAIADTARRHGVTLIEADPYSALLPARTASLAELAPDITWHIATLSKCASPALRVAHVLAPDAAGAARLAGTLRATVLMAPPIMSALASRWIADGTLGRLALAIAAENAARQQIAAGVLGGFGAVADPHGPHLWLPLPAWWRAAEFADHAERAGVPVARASLFAAVAHPPEAVRVSLGSAPDHDRLAQALQRIAALVARPAVGVRAVV